MKDLTTETQNILTKARGSANKRNHDYVSSEHILEVFLEDNSILPSDLVEKIKVRLNEVVKDGNGPILVNPPLTPRTKKILALASKETESGRIDFVTPWFLFVGLVKEAEGVAGQILKEFGITYSNIYTKPFLTIKNIPEVRNYSLITPKQVAATLEATPTIFTFLGNRYITRSFCEAVMENCNDKQYWSRHNLEYKYQRGNSFFRSISDLSSCDKLRGIRSDILILTERPTENELQQYFMPMISARLSDVIKPRGIYLAHIPEKPKTVEERLAALEKLVAEGKKLKFYDFSHPDDDIF